MGSEQNRFPHQERRKRWGGCFAALPCFRAQKQCKRIVPSRAPEGNPIASQPMSHSNPPPSLLAPPSSPASFSHSAVSSTIQSPTSFTLSATSPTNPTSTMFATGPYAHETQLVSPPVFSTFTTEPSTAPFTPPPELAHLTTPSSPDVPFAQFLTSNIRTSSKNTADLQSTYSLYPGSPAASLQSPPSWTSFDSARNAPASNSPRDANFFCPATFAQFYLDQNPNLGGRISVSKDSEAHPNRYSRSPMRDAEELDAYRASFGFSADEIVSTSQYVEITDDSFAIAAAPPAEVNAEGKEGPSDVSGCTTEEDDDVFAKAALMKSAKKYQLGLSSSDAEIEYRRGRSIREGRGDLRWRC